MGIFKNLIVKFSHKDGHPVVSAGNLVHGLFYKNLKLALLIKMLKMPSVKMQLTFAFSVYSAIVAH